MSGKFLYDSKSGEEEYLIEEYLINKMVKGSTGRREVEGYQFGTNPW